MLAVAMIRFMVQTNPMCSQSHQLEYPNNVASSYETNKQQTIVIPIRYLIRYIINLLTSILTTLLYSFLCLSIVCLKEINFNNNAAIV